MKWSNFFETIYYKQIIVCSILALIFKLFFIDIFSLLNRYIFSFIHLDENARYIIEISVPIILVFALLPFIVFYGNYKYSINKKRLIPAFYIVIVYILIRLNEFQIELIGLTFFQSIKYADLVISVLFIYLIVVTGEKSNSPKIIAPHNAVLSNGIDKLKFDHLAKGVSNYITEFKYTDSFTIGIEGPWGYGKTTFVNFIRKHLNKEKFIIIDFSAFDDVLLNNNHSFLIRLEESLSKELFNSSIIRSDIKKYLSLISAYSQDATLFTSKINSIFIDEDLDKVKERVNHSISNSNKRIIFIVDDIDRLMPDETIKLLITFRSFFNFDNTFCILMYDRELLNKQFSQRVNADFLDKFIQLEISPPSYSELDLRKILVNLFVEKFTGLKKEIIEYSLIEPSGEDNISNFLINLRDVYRFYYLCELKYTSISNQVCFYDFIRIELLKFKYPSFMRDLFINRYDYLVVDTSEGLYSLIITKKKLNDKINSDALRVISSIFNKDNKPYREKEKSVRLLSRFGLYFDYLSEYYFSVLDFDHLRDHRISDLTNYSINLINNGKSIPLVEHIASIRDFKSEEDYETLFLIFLYASHVKFEVLNDKNTSHAHKQILRNFSLILNPSLSLKFNSEKIEKYLWYSLKKSLLSNEANLQYPLNMIVLLYETEFDLRLTNSIYKEYISNSFKIELIKDINMFYFLLEKIIKYRISLITKLDRDFFDNHILELVIDKVKEVIELSPSTFVYKALLKKFDPTIVYSFSEIYDFLIVSKFPNWNKYFEKSDILELNELAYFRNQVLQFTNPNQFIEFDNFNSIKPSKISDAQ